MPRHLVQYLVFIATPGGLDGERRVFRDQIESYSRVHAEPRGVSFHPVGWEETIGGAGRPQALINDDLRQCDYAVFVLHDRWGTPTGSGHTSGTEEEWALAEELYAAAQIRNIALFFKDVEASKLGDPGPQLEKVLAFRERIAAGRRYLYKHYGSIGDFEKAIETHLARWLLDHERATRGLSLETLPAASPRTRPARPPGFAYWMGEVQRLIEADPPDYSAALYCAGKASAEAAGDVEWARAQDRIGGCLLHLAQPNEAVARFEAIAARFDDAATPEARIWQARALVNKGIALRRLGRGPEAIGVYQDVLARFSTAHEPGMREQVARALLDLGWTFNKFDRIGEAIGIYDDVLARYGSEADGALAIVIEAALVGKGMALVMLGRFGPALAVFDTCLARYRMDDLATAEPIKRELVATVLAGKGLALSIGRQYAPAVAVYDEMLAAFGDASAAPLREWVADAMLLKGEALAALGRRDAAIAAYDAVIARFGAAAEPTLRKITERAVLERARLAGAGG